MYFANVANSLLWWSYVKACWRSFISKITRKNITFKATAKGGSKLKNSPLRDIWLAIVMFILLTVSIAVAIWQLVDGANVFSPLIISVLWAAYAVVPPFLLLFYAVIGPGLLLQFFCRYAFDSALQPEISGPQHKLPMLRLTIAWSIRTLSCAACNLCLRCKLCHEVESAGQAIAS